MTITKTIIGALLIAGGALAGCGGQEDPTAPAPAAAQADQAPGPAIPLGIYTVVGEVGTADMAAQLGDLRTLILARLPGPESFMTRVLLSRARSDSFGAGTFEARSAADGIHLTFSTLSNPGCDKANAADPSVHEEWILKDVAKDGSELTVVPGKNASGRSVRMRRAG